jgi:uncharacterized FAD-dependent dehydrogenase
MPTSQRYDVAIIGTGPAGMFAALELIDRAPRANIVMFERGPVRDAGDKDNITSGWGGAGAFSDGKLDLGSCVGGTIGQCIGEDCFNDLMAYVDARYIAFGGRPDIIEAKSDKDRWAKVQDLKVKALASNLDLAYFPIRHLGTDTAHDIVENIRAYLGQRGVEIRTGCPVEHIVPLATGGYSLRLGDGSDVLARMTLAAPGRSGAEWFAAQAKALGLKLKNNGPACYTGLGTLGLHKRCTGESHRKNETDP